jgi:hypothetical protein
MKEGEMRKIYLLPCACAVIAGVATTVDLEATQPCPVESEYARLELREVTRGIESVDTEAYEPFDVQISSSVDGVHFRALYERNYAFSLRFQPVEEE